MQNSPAAILQQFIDDEASTYLLGVRGSFYPDNHHRIKPLVARAHKLLPGPQLVELYFHLLRLNECPTVKSTDEFEAMRSAYDSIKPLFTHGYPCCSMERPKGLFLFGSDDQGALSGEPETTHESFLRHLKFWRYADSFWHMPGMLKKQKKFIELSGDQVLLNRVTKVLLRVDLVEDIPTATCLWFWSLVLLAIQGKESGGAVVKRLLQAKCNLNDRTLILETLARYLRASARVDLLLHFAEMPNIRTNEA